jgi:hypothetical protein
MLGFDMLASGFQTIGHGGLQAGLAAAIARVYAWVDVLARSHGEWHDDSFEAVE